MADPSRRPGPADGTDVGSGPGSGAGTPRWVKVLVIVAVAAVLLLVVLQVVGWGGHGPGRHLSGLGDPAPLAQRP